MDGAFRVFKGWVLPFAQMQRPRVTAKQWKDPRSGNTRLLSFAEAKPKGVIVKFKHIH